MAALSPVRLLHVRYHGNEMPLSVGRLYLMDRRIFFQADPELIRRGLPLSPFKLPIRPETVEGERQPFEGLHGVFNDSLPDGWGRLLLDRKLTQQGIDPAALTPLDRLAYVGDRAMGALSYRPEYAGSSHDGDVRLDDLASEAEAVLAGESAAMLEELLALGGSPGGARPKILVGCNEDLTQLIHGCSKIPETYTAWMIKFRGGDVRHGKGDAIDVGAVEYVYSRMAMAAGIDMPSTHLFPAKEGPGYFGIQRFDRTEDGRRVHVHSVCGLLHADHRLPSLTYEHVHKLTRGLTKDQRQVDQMFRRMAFNVMSCNRDDHTKNFAFVMNADQRTWSLSPAYDLTYCAGPGGEHSMTIAGEGRTPTAEHLRAVAKAVGVDEKLAITAMDEVRAALSEWPRLAADHGVTRETIQFLSGRMAACGGPKWSGKGTRLQGEEPKP